MSDVQEWTPFRPQQHFSSPLQRRTHGASLDKGSQIWCLDVKCPLDLWAAEGSLIFPSAWRQFPLTVFDRRLGICDNSWIFSANCCRGFQVWWRLSHSHNVSVWGSWRTVESVLYEADERPLQLLCGCVKYEKPGAWNTSSQATRKRTEEVMTLLFWSHHPHARHFYGHMYK